MNATATKTAEILARTGATSVVVVGRESVIVRDCVTHYVVTGNGEYTVYQRAGKVRSCGCQGFRFRSACKHAAAVQAVINAW